MFHNGYTSHGVDIYVDGVKLVDMNNLHIKDSRSWEKVMPSTLRESVAANLLADEPRWIDADRRIVAEWIATYPAASTRNVYRFQGTRLLDWLNKPLCEITDDDIYKYVYSLEPIKITTRRTILYTLRSLLLFCRDRGELPKISLDRLQVIAYKWGSFEATSEVDVSMMIEQASNLRDKALIALFYEVGLQVGEICRLDWTSINDRDSSGRYLVVISRAKNSRKVSLTGRACKLLSELRSTAAFKEAVFVSQRGGRLDCGAIGRILKTAAYRVGRLDLRSSPS